LKRISNIIKTNRSVKSIFNRPVGLSAYFQVFYAFSADKFILIKLNILFVAAECTIGFIFSYEYSFFVCKNFHRGKFLQKETK